MANKVQDVERDHVPFSDMTPTEMADYSAVERPYNTECNDEMLQALAFRYEFDMWCNQFPRES